jgi:molybdopterin converting factor small subunit
LQEGKMRVSIGFFGILRDQLGQKSLDVDLPEGAGLADLMDAVAPLMEQKVAWAWDREGRRFSPRVVVSRKGVNGIAQGKVDADAPLADGEEFVVFPPLAGG